MMNSVFIEASPHPLRSMAEYLLKQCDKDVKTFQQEEFEKLQSKLSALTQHLESVVEENRKLKRKDEEWQKFFQKQHELSQQAQQASQLVQQPYAQHFPYQSMQYQQNMMHYPSYSQNMTQLPATISSMPYQYNCFSQNTAQTLQNLTGPSNPIRQPRKKRIPTSSEDSSSDENEAANKKETTKFAQLSHEVLKQNFEDAQEFVKQVSQSPAVAKASLNPPKPADAKMSSTCEQEILNIFEAKENVADSSSESGLIIDLADSYLPNIPENSVIDLQIQKTEADMNEILKKFEEDADNTFSNMPLLIDKDLTSHLKDYKQEENFSQIKPFEIPENVTAAAAEKVDDFEVAIASSMSSGFFEHEHEDSVDMEDGHEQHPAKELNSNEIDFFK